MLPLLGNPAASSKQQHPGEGEGGQWRKIGHVTVVMFAAGNDDDDDDNQLAATPREHSR